jgi:hypothetical protein
MNNGWVIAHTHGGLGNRLRVLLGALSYADLIGAQFSYVWPRRISRFHADFYDLWESNLSKLPTALGYTVRLAAAKSDENIHPALAERRLRYIDTDHEIRLPDGARPWESYLRELVPTSAIRGSVWGTWKDALASKTYIGVMVRGHKRAHTNTKQTSTPDWFVDRMIEIRRTIGDVTFFLSCDDQETQRRILTRVSGVVACDKRGGYNSERGLAEAVADLYLLAASSYLIGPFWSSFVMMAHRLMGPGFGLETPVSPTAHNIPRLGSRAVDPIRPWLRPD